MKSALQLDLSYEQVLALVKKLPKAEKLKLSKELEKEAIDSKLTKLLATFQTDKLSQSAIDEEVEIVRQQIYEGKKH